MCPKVVALVTLVKEVKGGRGAKFIESEGRGEDNRVSRTVGMCFEKTTLQTFS